MTVGILQSHVLIKEGLLTEIDSCGEEAMKLYQVRSHKVESQESPQSLVEAKISHHEGVLHFLFLVRNSMKHAHVWKKFFAAAPPGSWSAWVHCSDHCPPTSEFGIPGIRVVSKAASEYCWDLVSPTVQLLTHALKDTSGVPNIKDKFVLVSGTTLPLKSFPAVHRTLTSSGDSEFSIWPSRNWPTANLRGNKQLLVKASQWFVLNRQHAMILTRNWSPARSKRDYAIPVRTGVPTQHEVTLRQLFKPSLGTAGCTDEEAVFSSIFGAYDVHSDTILIVKHFPGLGNVSFPSAEFQGSERTLVIWDESKHPVVREALSDPSSEVLHPSASHPAVFKRLSTKLASALHASPFLFARKFEPNSVSEEDVDILLNTSHV